MSFYFGLALFVVEEQCTFFDQTLTLSLTLTCTGSGGVGLIAGMGGFDVTPHHPTAAISPGTGGRTWENRHGGEAGRQEVFGVPWL